MSGKLKLPIYRSILKEYPHEERDDFTVPGNEIWYLDLLQYRYAKVVLKSHHDNISRAALALGVSRVTLRRLIERGLTSYEN